MSPRPIVTGIAERYDWALRYARHDQLPPDHPRPRPTRDWPPENIELLERYCTWRLAGGASEDTTLLIYMPMAGHVLGLALKPHPELDLKTDLQPAMDYILAKKLSPHWTKVCRNALANFRRFLRYERGLGEAVATTPYDVARHTAGLPDWLVRTLQRYQHIQQRNWRAARLEYGIRRFWSSHLRVWRYLCLECGLVELTDIKRQHLFDYMEQRLVAGYAVSGINNDLRTFHAFLGFLQDQGYRVPRALLRILTLKEPDDLPRFLTDEQVCLLRDDFEARLQQARNPHQLRNALLDQAAFYLLWQAGLRVGEVEELRLEDLDFTNRKLTVRQGKGLKDRSVYLTDIVVAALKAFMAVRGQGFSEHVFLFRNRALRKDLVRDRIKAAGRRIGVKVTPHRLRHTCATQLLNAGCRVTSIQRFLGHKTLDATMIYARVHNHTVAEDYFSAMERIEKRLGLLTDPEPAGKPLENGERNQLLALAEQLAEPELPHSDRLELVSQMRWLLEPQSVIE